MLAAVLVLSVLLIASVWRFVRRSTPGPRTTAARERALAVAEAALEEYRRARSEVPDIGADELKVRVLRAVSGEPEAAARGRLTKAQGLSRQHATLQMLIVGVAVRKERELADEVGSEQLMKNIVEAQKVVMALIPSDL